MDADKSDIFRYVHNFAHMGSEVNPILIYFYQNDVAASLRRLFVDRGKKWMDYQIDWKVKSPYCQNRNLSGEEGILQLYKEYRSITDEVFSGIQWQKLSIENSAQDWTLYRKQILDFLGLEYAQD